MSLDCLVGCFIIFYNAKMKPIKIAVLMDDISDINPKKDTTLALMLEAKRRGWEIYTFDSHALFAHQNQIFAYAAITEVADDLSHWFVKKREETIALTQFKVILMRKNPPFDMNYIYATYLLEQAENQGVLVVNKPQSLRDFNEKLAILSFPNCIPDTLVSSDNLIIKNFLKKNKTIVIKPLNEMGGEGIFKLNASDNPTQITRHINQLTQNNTPLMAQKFLPEIAQGDKRIILINGSPIPYALARMPKKGSFKGNLAQGAIGISQPLSQRDHWLCQQIAPTLKAKKLLFVGLDIIGDYITEINITSPTGIRELDSQCHLNIAAALFDVLSKQI